MSISLKHLRYFSDQKIRIQEGARYFIDDVISNVGPVLSMDFQLL